MSFALHKCHSFINSRDKLMLLSQKKGDSRKARADRSNSFLTDVFDIIPTGQANNLDVQNVLLIVDSRLQIHPSGTDSKVGAFTGNIAQTGVKSEIVFQQGQSSYYTTFRISTNSTKNTNFIYVVPSVFLDGSHNLQLQIAGSKEGTKIPHTS